MQYGMKFLSALVCLCSVTIVWNAAPLKAQEDLPAALTDALSEITEADVKATVSFLACDELGGRDTPSPGLNIASAYIASRFEAAGLKGGAEDGSFFQVHEIATSQVPQSGITFEREGQPETYFGLISAGAEVFSYEGKIAPVSADDDFRKMEFSGPVYFEPKSLTNPRDQFNVMRQVSTLRKNGATAVLLGVEEGSPFISMAKRAQQPSMVTSRGSFPSGSLVVPKLDPNANFKIVFPKQISGTAQVKNVIGVLPGSDPELSKEAIIITAHLDHIGRSPGQEDSINNGADDNATGCTAVCEIADAYGALEVAPKRSVIFMTFWGEEKGLLGSRHYCNNPEWPLDKTIANINIEMVGRPEAGAHEKTWMTGWHQSNLGKLMNVSSQRAGVLIFEHPQFSEMLYRASDNAAFVDKGVIAHSFSAGSLHPDYHQPGDEFYKLDTRHMTRVIQGLFVGSFPIANGEVTPEKK